MLTIALFLGSTSLASASAPPTPHPAPHTWFCTASGYDERNQLRSISGDLKGSLEDAQQDALRACRGFWMACSVGTCIQET